MDNIKIEILYVIFAMTGGVARYLNSFAVDGVPFKFSIFIASAIVSGFSGYMFSLLGVALAFKIEWIFIMAGTGGFFGEQTMKYILERVLSKVK